jgi:hypothetical protein
MSQSFVQIRMNRCGRCYAGIPEGLFCDSCRSFFAQFAQSGSHGGVLVRAGAVRWRGAALLLPGPSCNGKTALVRELSRRGARYTSSEYAILDSSGRVHDFLGDPNISPLVPSQYREGAGALPLALVLFSQYLSGATWEPRRLTPGQAVLGLLSNSASARRNPAEAVRLLSRAAMAAPAFQAERVQARTAAVSILDLMERFAGGQSPTFYTRRSDS